MSPEESTAMANGLMPTEYTKEFREIGCLTVSRVKPTILPDAALMVVVPAATAVAAPVEVIVATDAEDELQAGGATRY